MKSEKSLVYTDEKEKELNFFNEKGLPLGYNPIILKSNCLIQASGRKKPAEIKLYNVFHWLASEELKINPETRIFQAKLKDLINYAGLKNKNLKYIRDVITGLKRTEITYDIFNLNNQLTAFWIFSILQEVKVYIGENGEVSENSRVDFMFSERILETIIKPLQEGGYTRLSLYSMCNLSGLYACILYQNLKAYEFLIKSWKRREISIEEFRKLTGTEDVYPDFWNLKKKVLESAKKEINGKDEDGDPITDIIMNYRLKKTWRKITGISFSFDNNPKFKIKWFKETKKERETREEAEAKYLKEQEEKTGKEREETFNKILDDLGILGDTVAPEDEKQKEEKTIKTFNKIFEERPAPSDYQKSLKAFNNILESEEIDLEDLEIKAKNYIEYSKEHPEKYPYNMINRIEKGIYRQNLKSSKATIITKQPKLLSETEDEKTIDNEEFI